MPERLPISVCMISGAEAHRIERALSSVSDWAAELVIVLNQEVSDGTEEMARNHGAKVFREPWKGYVAQVNSAATKATQGWLLGLDADEEVSPRLHEEIQRILAEPEWVRPFAAFSVPRLSWYCGRWIRHGDWYPDRKVRLWRRGRAHWVGLDPHYKLEVDGRVGKLKAELRHYSNESIAGHVSKIVPYQAAFVKAQAGSGSRPAFFELGVRPWWRFVRAYLLRLGFLDGWQGFYIAKLNAFSTLTRQAMVREAEELKSRGT